MADWGSAYFLEENINDQDIWTFLVKGLQDFVPFALPETVSENYFFKKGDCVFSWDNADETDEKLSNLEFKVKIDGKDDFFTVVFEKNSTLPFLKQKLRRLIVWEKYKGEGLPICYRFMPFIKPYVPKQFLLESILDEKWNMYRLLSDMKSSKGKKEEKKLDLAEIDFNLMSKNSLYSKPGLKNIEKFSKHNALEAMRSSYTKPKKEEKSEDEKEKDPASEAQKELEEHFFLIKNILFYADINEKFWFDEEWIPRFCKEMWFLNAHYNRYAGIKSYVKNMFVATNPLYEKWSHKRHKSKSVVEEINGLLDDFIDNMIGDDPITWRREAHITVRFPDRDVYFTKENTSFTDYNSFRDTIVGTVILDEAELYRHINTRFIGEEIVKSDNDTPLSVKQKVTMFLKEHNIDLPSIQKLRDDFAQLEAENKALKKELEEARAQHQEDYATLEQKLRNASLPVAALSESNDAYKKDVEELKQALKARDAENKALKERVSFLEKSLYSKSDERSEEGINLFIPSSVAPLFKDEISDYLYTLLYDALENESSSLPHNRADEANRKRDVVSDLLEKKTFRKEMCESEKKIERIASILKSDAKYPLDLLLNEGFGKVAGTKNHPKYYFYDEKYQMTFPGTPSDFSVAWREISDMYKCLFLIQ